MPDHKPAYFDREGKDVNRPNETVLSIQSLERLLRAVITSPNEVEEDLRTILRTSLATQNGMARLDLEQYGIRPRWLNTIKARSAGAIVGGFEVLDALRKEALAAIVDQDEVQKRPTRGTKQELSRQLNTEKEAVQQRNDEIALMSAKIKEYVRLARSYAEKAGDLDGFERRHLELMRKFRNLPNRD